MHRENIGSPLGLHERSQILLTPEQDQDQTEKNTIEYKE